MILLLSFKRRVLLPALLAPLVILAPSSGPGAAEARGLDVRIELGSHAKVRTRHADRRAMPPVRLARRLSRQGYRNLRSLTYLPDRGIYRVKAVTRAGRPVILRVDARTGRLIAVRHLAPVDRRTRKRAERRREGRFEIVAPRRERPARHRHR